MTPAAALQRLRTDPHYFLRHYPINCAGANVPHHPNTANQFPFHIRKRDNQMQGEKLGHVGATRPVRGPLSLLNVTVEISSFRIGHGGAAAAAPFNAASVPMLYYDDLHNPPAHNINAMGAYLLDNTDDIMITGQLSGCCFCVTPYAGGLACIHVNPRGYPGAVAARGVNLQTDLTANGQFANYAGALTTFGRQNYPGHGTVIGVRLPGGWQIFAQTSNDLFETLTGAFQVYPGPLMPL